MVGTADFPLTVAAIDVGTNAIRFVAAEFVDRTHWIQKESVRIPVRLGHQAFLTGRLAEDAMAGAVEAMATFRRSLDTHGVVEYRAVATSAVRESRNGGDLVERIRAETGIRLETITGSEEARLTWVAASTRVSMDHHRWMMADLGGGSLEISTASSEGVEWIESHTMGTVRVLEELGAEAEDQEALRELVVEYAARLRLPDWILEEKPPLNGFMATGGNIEALAELAGCDPDGKGVARLPVPKLEKWIDRLARISVEERIERFGFRQDRADVILPAAILYHRVAQLAGAETILVPNLGVKEGVLVDLVDDLVRPQVHASRRGEEALRGALALGRRFQFDEAHGDHVAHLAMSLFDQLVPLHGLGEVERRILASAAALHDIGQFLSHRKHHKHSLYIIKNSELPGFSRSEVPLVALVARYHRRAEPKDSHYLYEDLSREDRNRVGRLGAILRLADALDREHLQRVTSVEVREGDGDWVVEARGRGDLRLERWAFDKKSGMFETIFGVPARLELSAESGALRRG